MSRRQQRALISRLIVLLLHLLKWQYQPQRRSTSWRQTIIEQRQRMTRLLQGSPSLRARLPAFLSAYYPAARAAALEETGLPDLALPAACPWTVEQILDPDFWPEE